MTWDVICDFSGYGPQHIERAADHVDNDTRCIFVSTISVYAHASGSTPITEQSPIFATTADQVDPESADSYGQLKALAEAEVRARFPQHHVVRPGVICGPDDPTDRVTYWVTRFAESGPHIVPEAHWTPLQYIDVRDLAAWLVSLESDPQSGTYNAVAPPTTLSQFLDDIERVSGSAALTATSARARVHRSTSESRPHRVPTPTGPGPAGHRRR